MSDFGNKNPNNVLGGHKATLHNPNVSEEAKEHSKKVLENAGEGYDESSSGKTTTDDGEKNAGNVAGGYKATLNNPNVSDEAKEHAKKKLEGLE
ncbi:conidiation protein 6 [Neurospora intermedia]|uniref:Conidiation protein 6 n=1 Tax=Neurospora intermedia TaxID=5142 RepID=A0ABR3DLB2_NEUIN